MAKVVSLSNLMAHDVFDVLQTPNDPFPLDAFTQKVEHIYSVMYGSDLARAARLIFRAEDK
jgi:hypothetical protein